MVGSGAPPPARLGDAERAEALNVELDRIEAHLDGVERALTQLDDGTYGTCEQCREHIGDDILAADPLASRCADHH